MKTTVDRIVLIVVLSVSQAVFTIADSAQKRIAITFDDAPRTGDALMDADTRSKLLIDGLAKAKIQGAMFFVTAKNLDARGEQGIERLKQYVKAGHTLANHSQAHNSANSTEVEVFLADVQMAQNKLNTFAGVEPYFRFPFLHEGAKPKKRDAIRKGLQALGLKQGYVTVDNYDWYLQSLFSEAIRSEQALDLEGWRDLYVDVLMAAVRFYDDMAQRTLDRSPAHVLLLHENELAALFIDDLANALRAEAWEIIPAHEAYQDELSKTIPDTLFLGQGRVAALAASKGELRHTLIHPFESEATLRAMAVQRNLVGFAKGAYLQQTPPGMVPKRFAPGLVSLADQYEYGSSFSADGLEFFFAVAIEGRGEIRTMRYNKGQWSTPKTLLAHPEYSFADPFLSRNSARLYFITTEPEKDQPATGKSNIAYVNRTAKGWSDPVHIQGAVNTPANEYYVSIADDGTMAFASNINAEPDSDFDIYLSKQSKGQFATPKGLDGQATTRAYEGDPFLAPDGSYILFSSTRKSGEGRRDLFVSFAEDDGTWSKALSLGKRINTPEIEFCPFVTRDGKFLFYTSNEDIYWVDAAVIDVVREQWQAKVE